MTTRCITAWTKTNLAGFQLLNEEKKAIFDRIQAENGWIRNAPSKEERPRRQEESMNRAMSGIVNSIHHTGRITGYQCGPERKGG